jgi:maleylpyruvate isomerase
VPSRPSDDLRRVADAQRRFLAAIEPLGDAELRRPSRLPGWTVGHVLAHVARNADSHRRRTDAAVQGLVVDQYPGGYGGRAAEIEMSAAQGARQLVDDVRVTGEAMAAAWQEAPESAWESLTRDVGGRERPLRALPARRWQELEVHLVDLDVGVTHRQWSPELVAVWLPVLRSGVGDRLPTGALPPAPGTLDERDELAWLYGRLTRDDLPALAPWG